MCAARGLVAPRVRSGLASDNFTFSFAGDRMQLVISTEAPSFFPKIRSSRSVPRVVASIATLLICTSAQASLFIGGSPTTSVGEGKGYSFEPWASDSAKRRLTFVITNKPAWANFDSTDGKLSGTASSKAQTYSNIKIGVTDGVTTSYLSPFSIAVNGTQASTALSISGSPAAAVVVGTTYSFTPTAKGPSGETLKFSANKVPAWASFNSSTGKLSGTPEAASIGTTSDIVLSVSDGQGSASLAAFSITVTQVANGSATVTWTPPTQNTNGSTLTNLAGYNIEYGTSASELTQSIQVTNPGLTSYVVSNLAPGTYYFGVAAYNASGEQSSLSNVRSKTVQ